MNLGELLFVVNEDTMVAVFDNETGDTIYEPQVCSDIFNIGLYNNFDIVDSDEYANCTVMDVHVDNGILNICIEV